MSNKADAVAITDEGTSYAELGHARLYVWNTSTLVWDRMTQPGGGAGGGGAATIADGADVAQGATTDLSSANTVVGILKAIKAAITGTLTISGGVTGSGTGFQDGSQVAGGAAVTVASQTTTMAGLRNASGNASVMPGISDTADAVGTSAGGNLPRTWAELAGFNGTSWDRLRSTIANGLAVDVTRVTGTVNTNPTGETAGVGIGAAADTSASNSVIGRLKALIALFPTALGQGTMATSMKVVIASDQSAVAVSGPATDTQLRATPLPVSGTVTANPATGGGKTLLFAAVSVAGAGSNAIVAADASNKIKVVSYVLVADGAVTAKWQNAATDLTGAMSLAANGGAAISGSTAAHLFETSVNQALNLNLGGAVGVRGHISYFKEP